MTGPVAPGPVGTKFPFTITVRMTAPSTAAPSMTAPSSPTATAKDVKVVAPFPAALNVISAYESPNTGGVVIPGPTEVTATWSSMSVPDDSVKVILIIAEGTESGVFPVTSTVSTTTTESNYNNNKANAAAIIAGGGDTIDLSLTMTSSSSTVQVNQIFFYTINVKMTAASVNATANFVQVISSMPSGIVIDRVEESPNKGGMFKVTPSRTQLIVFWNSMSYPYDDSRTLMVYVKATKSGRFDTSARVTTTTPETTLINNDCSLTVTADGQGGDKLGACCTGQTGMCQEGVTRSQCATGSIWELSGKCEAGGFCSGACCRSDGSCDQTLKKDCYNGQWNRYGSCTTCDSNNCHGEWQKCKPSKSNCCSGLSCEYTWAGCKVGSYVCKSRPNSQCVGEASPCGGSTGNTCCQGLTCSWDYYNNVGTCRSSSGCIPPGGGCSSDYSCCRGCVCMGSKSRYVTYNMCNKRCSNYGCYYQRQINCQCFYASAASL